MALSDEQVSHIIEIFSCGDGKGHDVHGIARAVEAEVQKQDEALIRLMLAALEHHTEQTRPITRTDDAITAARLRLESKP